MHSWHLKAVIGTALIAPLVSAGSASAQGADPAVIEQLQEIIAAQQRQLEEQAKVLQDLQAQVEAIQRSTEEAKTAASQATVTARAAQTQAQTQAQRTQAPAADGSSPTVTSDNEKVRLTISGQINRAMNFANDGDKTKYYNVDNDASNSRIRFVGTGEATEDLTIGTQIEVAIAPNESARVSQDDETSGDFFDQRRVEAWLDSAKFGRVTLGKGSSASDSSAEVDLSQLDVIMYSNVSTIVGGLKFNQKGTDTLTGFTVSDAFSNFDGLSRTDRIRYDTPAFNGFTLSTSASSDQRYDGAVRWAGAGYGLQVAAAAAVADPSKDGIDLRASGSTSVLHENTGLNLTLASGADIADNRGDPQNWYVKGGWLGRVFAVGDSAFGVDYTRSVNTISRGASGNSVGGAFVQQFTDFGTEMYTQVRWFDLSTGGGEPAVDDVVVGTVGTRVKF